MKFCTSPTDAIARHLLIEYAGREDSRRLTALPPGRRR
jgi:hypothetical protein